MRRRRWLVVLAVLGGGILAGGLWGREDLAAWGRLLSGGGHAPGVQPVPEGWQEIAFLNPATSADNWERLVAAVRFLQASAAQQSSDDLPVQLDLEHVFTERTTDVPEVSLGCTAAGPRLVVRWYKISSEMDISRWIEQLCQRQPPPLAILGGETSERALLTAKALQDQRPNGSGPAPLFLLTTATADRFVREGLPSAEPLTAARFPRLMEVYPGRSFRFAFSNSHMAAVVLSFVREHPQVWSPSPHLPRLAATLVGRGAGIAGQPDLTLGVWWAAQNQLAPISFYAVAWEDDPYSLDLADHFAEVFKKYFGDSQMGQAIRDEVPYGVGDRERPNPAEVAAIDRFFERNPLLQGGREVLVLPTGTERARRFLRTLANQIPQQLPNLVVLSGDSISFNHVYRDREVAWNIEDLPVPLIFFSHRNPIHAGAGFHPQASATAPWVLTGTHDLLLYYDVVRALWLTVWEGPQSLAGPEVVSQRLRQLYWRQGRLQPQGPGQRFFNAQGDRQPGTGEHIVWVEPVRDNGRILARSILHVWRLQAEPSGSMHWRQVRELHVTYNWPVRNGRE